MAEKLKMLMDIFGKVTFGVLIAAAVFISVFEGFDAQISVKILWQILAVSAVCSVPVLMFDSDATKELSKKGMFVRQLLYVNIIVLGLGKLFEWFSFQNFSMVLFMEVLIIAVYAVVNIICYLSDRADAQSMNKKLLEMKKNKKE